MDLLVEHDEHKSSLNVSMVADTTTTSLPNPSFLAAQLMARDHLGALRPQCVASTTRHFSQHKSAPSARAVEDVAPFSQAQFSSDGTTIVTQHADHSFRTFILPVDLLDDSAQPHELVSNATILSPTAIQSYALYPHFNLADASTAVFLSAGTDLPISLINAIDGKAMGANYPLVDPTTEAYIAPKSLSWTPDALRFVAGSHNQISVFDAHRYNEGPVLSHRTAVGKKQKKLHGDSPGCRGLIMALGISPDGMLAAGTNERQIAIHDNVANAECWTAFSLDGQTAGSGITQLAWSPDGQYLLAAERGSDCVHVYDIRNTLRRVSILEDRRAITPQRMGVNVIPTADGYELWTGGTDGCVRMWKNPGSIEDRHHADAEFDMHDAPVSSAVWHPQGAVLATCSGLRTAAKPSALDDDDESSSSDEETSTSEADNTLKIWTI